MQTGSKEFDLLCACAAVELAPGRAARIASASSAAIDWIKFLQMAELDNVLPLAARNLRQHGTGVPDAIQQSLKRADEQNSQRSLWFASECARILDHFEKRQLRAVPYKGPVLAQAVYGDVSLRSFNDLDFLISPADFAAARQALAELDYRPSKALSAPIEKFWLKYGYECAFDGKAAKYLVELQWNLLPYFFAIDLDIADLIARSTQAMVGEKKTSCLNPEDSLLVLCLHAAKHLWMRLIWICDIAETMRTQTIDYAVVVSRAREAGLLRILAVSAWLAENLLDTEANPAIRELFASDSEVTLLGKIFVERLSRNAEYDFESPEYFQLTRRLRERRADRLRYLWRLIWTPGDGDLASASLPEALFPLYRVVRIGRLVKRLGR